MMLSRTLLLGALAVAVVARADAQSPLERELARLAAGARGIVGVSAVHLETGRSVSLNADRSFPMASTYKIPIAVQLLTLVDRGSLHLDSLVRLEPTDVYTGTAGVISDYIRPGSALTIRNLLELMLRLSDNNATDVLLRIAGGGAAVTARLREIGVTGIQVDRPTWAVIANWRGRTDISVTHPISQRDFNRLDSTATPGGFEAAEAAFNRDPRDHATPAAMTTLLGKLWRREVLSPASTELLLTTMYRCETGPGRLKGLLPPNTTVAHKTGTIGGTTNDVGIIDLPDGAGHLLLAVYTTESTVPDLAGREAVIAQLARAAFDYFTLTR